MNFRLRTLVANFSKAYKSFTGPESFLDKGRTFVSCTPHLENEPDPGRKGLSHLHLSTLFAVPFDPGRLALAGAPAPILGDVSRVAISGGEYAFAGAPSLPGTFVYLARKGSAGHPISWLDSVGKTEPLHAQVGDYVTPRFSPDGKRLAFSMLNGHGSDIWVKDLDRDAPSRLSFLFGVNRFPVWSHDGKNIVFQSTNPAAPGLYWIRSDGSGEAQRLTDGKLGEFPYAFSLDGKRLVFVQSGNGGNQDIFTAPVEGHPGRGANGIRFGKPELFLRNGSSAAFSPDGRWLAYASSDSGTAEVYVRPFPGPGGRWQVSLAGGTEPVWAGNGRELFYRNGTRMMVAAIALHPTFTVGARRELFEGNYVNDPVYRSYDVTRDGQAFVMVRSPKPSADFIVVLNWFDQLREQGRR